MDKTLKSFLVFLFLIGFLFSPLFVNGQAPPDGCECEENEINICDDECEDPEDCCQIVTVPIVSYSVLSLVIGAFFLAFISIYDISSQVLYKSQYSALQKLSRKIRNFW